MTKSVLPDCAIEWSDTATVFVGTRAFNPFQSNSYVARVTFDSGRVVCVALRPGDAVRPAYSYAAEVREAAIGAVGDTVAL